MSALVVAVDPGPSYTGVVARQGESLLAYTVVTRGAWEESLEAYARRVLEDVEVVVGSARSINGDVSVYAVESYDPPNPHVGAVHPTQIAETAWLTGFVYQALRDIAREQQVSCVLVPPNKHGRSALGAYPEELVTEGERRGSSWRMRPAGRSTDVSHARSAFDVAGAAPAQLRIAEVD